MGLLGWLGNWMWKVYLILREWQGSGTWKDEKEISPQRHREHREEERRFF